MTHWNHVHTNYKITTTSADSGVMWFSQMHVHLQLPPPPHWPWILTLSLLFVMYYKHYWARYGEAELQAPKMRNSSSALNYANSCNLCNIFSIIFKCGGSIWFFITDDHLPNLPHGSPTWTTGLLTMLCPITPMWQLLTFWLVPSHSTHHCHAIRLLRFQNFVPYPNSFPKFRTIPGYSNPSLSSCFTFMS